MTPRMVWLLCIPLGLVAIGSTAWAGKTVSVSVVVNLTNRTATGSFGTAHSSTNGSYIGCAVEGEPVGDGLSLRCSAFDGTNSSPELGPGADPAHVSFFYAASTITSDSTISFAWDASGSMTSLTVDNSSLYAPKTSGARPADTESVFFGGGDPTVLAEGAVGSVRRSSDIYEQIGCQQQGGSSTSCWAQAPGLVGGFPQPDYLCYSSYHENTYQLGGEFNFASSLIRGDSLVHIEWAVQGGTSDLACNFISVLNDSRYAPKW